MFLILLLVFIIVFGLVVLVMNLSSAKTSQETKQTLAMLDTMVLSRPENRLQDEMLDIRKEEILSSIPWLNRMLYRIDVAPRLRLMLAQADMKWTVGGVILMSTAAFVITAWLVQLRTDSLLIALAAGSAAGVLPFAWVMRQRQKRFDRFEQFLPEALDLMVSALRAGHSLVSALGIAARETTDPIRKEFRTTFDEQNFGVDLRIAMLNLTTRIPTPDVRMVVTAILIQRDSGGNLAEVLEKVGSIMRERFRLKRQIRVHTAQGRMTGWILACLPLVLGFALYLLNPEHMGVLFTTAVGRQLVAAATIMTITGGLIIRKIIQIKV